jgi:hypothetical protein
VQQRPYQAALDRLHAGRVHRAAVLDQEVDRLGPLRSAVLLQVGMIPVIPADVGHHRVAWQVPDQPGLEEVTRAEEPAAELAEVRAVHSVDPHVFDLSLVLAPALPGIVQALVGAVPQE